MGSRHTYIFCIIVLALFLSQCKQQEKVSNLPSAVSDKHAKPCVQLTQSIPDNSLYFFAKAESPKEKIASQKAQKETVIQLVQFFQSEFIDGNQTEIFGRYGPIGGWEDFRKEWAETSFQIIGTLHNRNAFTHNQIVTRDSSGNFRAVDLLTVSHNWVRNHWEKTLKVTDPGVFNTLQKRDINPVQELETPNKQPCKS